MNPDLGVLVSSVSGSEVRRLSIDGEDYFLKRRYEKSLAGVLGLLAYGRRPMSGPMREFRMLRILANHGFRVAEPVAWGETRRLGIPVAGFLVVRAVKGQSMIRAYRDGGTGERVSLMRQLGGLTGRLHAAGFFEPLRMKDLLEDAEGGWTMIDRECRHPWRRGFSARRAITALARTARRTFRDGDRMGGEAGTAFLAAYREAVASCWKVGRAELRRAFFNAYRGQLKRYPNRSLWKV